MDYITTDGEYEATYIERRSRFIAVARSVANVEEGLEFLKDVKKRYKEATHYPYAIVSAPEYNEQKVSDDGEPQGTSGAPILTAIRGRGLSAVAVVVVRYFGGVKLGASGLTLAYGKAAKAVLEEASLLGAVKSTFYKVKLTYDSYGKFQIRSASFATITDTEYSDEVTATVATTESERLTELVGEVSAGKSVPVPIEEKYLFKKL